MSSSQAASVDSWVRGGAGGRSRPPSWRWRAESGGRRGKRVASEPLSQRCRRAGGGAGPDFGWDTDSFRRIAGAAGGGRANLRLWFGCVRFRRRVCPSGGRRVARFRCSRAQRGNHPASVGRGRGSAACSGASASEQGTCAFIPSSASGRLARFAVHGWSARQQRSRRRFDGADPVWSGQRVLAVLRRRGWLLVGGRRGPAGGRSTQRARAQVRGCEGRRPGRRSRWAGGSCFGSGCTTEPGTARCHHPAKHAACAPGRGSAGRTRNRAEPGAESGCLRAAGHCTPDR